MEKKTTEDEADALVEPKVWLTGIFMGLLRSFWWIVNLDGEMKFGLHHHPIVMRWMCVTRVHIYCLDAGRKQEIRVQKPTTRPSASSFPRTMVFALFNRYNTRKWLDVVHAGSMSDGYMTTTRLTSHRPLFAHMCLMIQTPFCCCPLCRPPTCSLP